VCVRVCVSECLCVCVRERVCVCVCVWVVVSLYAPVPVNISYLPTLPSYHTPITNGGGNPLAKPYCTRHELDDFRE
jgi:hypothetical protein